MEEAAHVPEGRGKNESAEAIQKRHERDSIELSRTRLFRELAVAPHPIRRKQLTLAIEHLNAKLRELDSQADLNL